MAPNEVRLETNRLSEFLQIVEDWRKYWDVGDRALYRGHRDFNWILMAKLFRDPSAKPQNLGSDDPLQVEKQLLSEFLPMNVAHDLECRLFHDFSRYLFAQRPDLVCTVSQEEKTSTKAMQEWRQLALAQHYGLPTRFLDFTTNMFVALFFAVEEPPARRMTIKGEWLEQDSAVWCIEVPKRRKVWEVWNEAGVWLSPLEFAEKGSKPPIVTFKDTAFVPENIDERIRAQGSVFMCEPRGKKNDWQLHVNLRDKTEICFNRESKKKGTRTLKICIPTETRESLRDQLDLAGINRATLFLDLEAAAKYLAWAIHQRRRSY
jgi:hypothetical protein